VKCSVEKEKHLKDNSLTEISIDIKDKKIFSFGK
jgi:hypothetical protein